MENYLDYKATIWCRIPIIDDTVIMEIIKKLNDGLLPSELYNESDLKNKLGQCEFLYDTEEFMPIVENDNQSTIEIYTGNDSGTYDCIWDNEKDRIKYSLEWFQTLPYKIIDQMFNTNLCRYLRPTHESEENQLQEELKAIEIIFQTKTKDEIKDLYANAILTEIKLMKNDNRN